jgi:hypothetical protein
VQLCLDVRKSGRSAIRAPRVFLCRKNTGLQEDCEEGDTDDDKEEKSPLPECSRLIGLLLYVRLRLMAMNMFRMNVAATRSSVINAYAIMCTGLLIGNPITNMHFLNA